MKWTKISKYSWESGPYTISASRVGEGYRYALWTGSDPGKLLAVRDTAEELKRMAKEAANVEV